jgi:hypothetical protein
MARPRKIESLIMPHEGMNDEDKRLLFIAAALTGLLARGNGANADATISAAMAYADAVLERLELCDGVREVSGRG